MSEKYVNGILDKDNQLVKIIPPVATESRLGGIKASQKADETLEVTVDPETGKAYVQDKTKLYHKAIFVGDSTSHGWDNGYYSFVDIFDERGDFGEVVKLAQGGATLGPYQIASIAEGKSCIEQIQNNIDEFTDADVCFLQFCLNDIKSAIAGSVQVGTADDTSETQTICGVARKIVETIYAKNPLVKIYFLNLSTNEMTMRTLWQMDNAANGNDTALENGLLYHKGWNKVVMGVFEEYGIPIINIMDGINFNTENGDAYTVTSSAGAHMNTAANWNVYRRIRASLDGASEKLYTPQPQPFIIQITAENMEQNMMPQGTFEKILSYNKLGANVLCNVNGVLVWMNEITSTYAQGSVAMVTNDLPYLNKLRINSLNQLEITQFKLQIAT